MYLGSLGSVSVIRSSSAHINKVALAAIRDEQTQLNYPSSLMCMPTRSSSGKTKDQLREGATGVFGDESKAEPANTTLYNKTLHAKIAELTLENDI
jgi:transposase